jgi:hypothetical protein
MIIFTLLDAICQITSLNQRRNAMTKFADDGSEQAARELVEQDRALVKAAREGAGGNVPGTFADRMKGKPTPTQEESDLAAHGAHIIEHEPDGSDPDPFNVTTRDMKAKPGGGYETRAAAPKAPPPPKTA